MKKLALSLAVLSLLSVTTVPLPAHSSESAQCRSTLAAVKRRLQKGRDVTISTRLGQIGRDDNPTGRPMTYVFTFKGPAAQSIVRSEKLQATLSKQIIQDCSEIATVTFVMWGTGSDGFTFGLMSDGTVQRFECLVPDRRNPPNPSWGQQICT
jgi:hypothetical protein